MLFCGPVCFRACVCAWRAGCGGEDVCTREQGGKKCRVSAPGTSLHTPNRGARVCPLERERESFDSLPAMEVRSPPRSGLPLDLQQRLVCGAGAGRVLAAGSGTHWRGQTLTTICARPLSPPFFPVSQSSGRLSEFQELSKIGEGTYGVVLRCRDKATGETVAVKCFKEGTESNSVSVCVCVRVNGGGGWGGGQGRARAWLGIAGVYPGWPTTLAFRPHGSRPGGTADPWRGGSGIARPQPARARSRLSVSPHNHRRPPPPAPGAHPLSPCLSPKTVRKTALREARTLAAMSHDHIVSLRDQVRAWEGRVEWRA